MASDRPDDSGPPARDRLHGGGRTSIANRDKPLFTSRHNQHPYQQPTEFYTDSLNTSYASHIPSPSPARNNYRGRGRRAHVSGKGLTATYNQQRENFQEEMSNHSSPIRNNGSKRSGWGSRGKGTPQLSTRNTPSPSRNHNAHHINGARTPSPRGRADSLLSPNSNASASSPPRGLAEAYQRIEDEELLASQDDTSDDDTGFLDEHALQDIPNNQLRRSWHSSNSPASRRSSRRLSPRPPIEAEEACVPIQSVESAGLQETVELEFDSRASSPFEEIARDEQPEEHQGSDMDSKHNRDEERVKNALANDIKPFSKARRKGRSGLTVDNLRRQEGTSLSGSSSTGSQSIDSRSEFSLNIPNGWGRKGRGAKSWLDRIKEDGALKSDPVAAERQPSEPAANIRTSDPIVDWMEAAAATPLPVVNSDSIFSTNSSVKPKRTSLVQELSESRRRGSSTEVEGIARKQSVQRLDSNERNSPLQRVSLEVPRAASATPKVDGDPHATLDKIRLRETESAVEQITHMKEKVPSEEVEVLSRNVSMGDISNEQAFQSKYGSLPHRGDVSWADDGQRPPLTLADELRINAEYEALVLGELSAVTGKDPMTDEPIVGEYEARPSSNLQTEDTTTNGEHKPAVRPGHSRDDSREILRTLARITSQSPSPQHQAAERLSVNADEHLEEEDFPEIRLPTPRVQERLSSASRSRQSSSQRTTKAETPLQTQPQPKLYMKTPIVTGAFIETPAPMTRNAAPEKLVSEENRSLVDAALGELMAMEAARKPPSRASSKESPVKLEDTAPKLPGSALAAILQKAKARKVNDPSEQDDTLQLDDSTIESLEDLLEFTENLTNPANPEDTTESLPPASQLPTKKPQIDLKKAKAIRIAPEDAQSYSDLASNLTHLKTSISDAKQGLGALQKRFSSSQKASRRLSSNLTGHNEDHRCNDVHATYDLTKTCKNCGIDNLPDDEHWAGFLEWQTVRVPMPRLWIWPENAWTPKITKTGWWVTLISALVVAEMVVGEMYSPPFYASKISDFGVDYDCPRPPFILAKLAWQTPISSFFMPIWTAICVFVRLVAGLMGISPGVFGHLDDAPVAEPQWDFVDAVVEGVAGMTGAMGADDMTLGADEVL